MAWVVALASSVLGLVLLLAGGAKAWRHSSFAHLVEAYRVLPKALVAPVAALLPLVEVGVGVLLLAGVWPDMTGTVAALLFATFAAAMTINLRRGRTDVSCGCFGSQEKSILTWTLVWRNVGLACVALGVALDPSPATEAALTVADQAAAIFVAGLALLCCWLARLLFHLLKPPVEGAVRTS